MSRLWLTDIGLFLGSVVAFAQEVVLSGTLRDGESGETLIGAVVLVEPGRQAASTNAYGFYSLTVPVGKQRVTYSYVGSQPHVVEFDLSESQRLHVDLKREHNTLEQVVISARRKDNNVAYSQIGALNLTMVEVKNVPPLFGEKDL